MIMNEELEKMQKEAVVVCFKKLSQHLLEGIGENLKRWGG
jgi:hypothetical protein